MSQEYIKIFLCSSYLFLEKVRTVQRVCVPMVAFSMCTEGLLHMPYGSIWSVLHCCTDLKREKKLKLKILSQAEALLGLGMYSSQ